MNNSVILNVEEYPVDTGIQSNSENQSNKTNDKSKYLIYGNNGCLQYETAYQQTPATWSFQSCDANKSEQQFKINQINTLNQYNNPVTNINNKNYIMKHQNNIDFGFYIVNPVNTYDQCLQLNNDGVSVMPCNMDSSQRFGTNYQTVL